MDTFKDLDALVPTDKQVLLGGKMYKLPGDIPLEIFVRVNKAGTLEDEDENAAMEELIGALTDLFSIMGRNGENYAEMRTHIEATLRLRGIKFLTTLLQEIYDEPQPEDEQPQDAEGNSSASGTTTTST